MTVLFFTDRSLETYWFFGNFQNFSDFVERKFHLLGNFFGRWLASKLLYQVPRRSNQLIDGLYHVHGNSNRPRLVGNSPRYRLPNPPCCISAELIAPFVLKLIDRFH